VEEWLAAVEAAAPLPALPGPTGSAPANGGEAAVRLGAEETLALLDELPELQRVSVEEVLLTALAGTLGREAGDGVGVVEVGVDARRADPLGLDLSRAVGCFTVVLPVRLDLGAAADPLEELSLAKEQYRGAVARGTEAALFADLAGFAKEGSDGEWRRRLAALPRPLLSLSWLGDAEATGAPDPGTALALSVRLDGDGLRCDWPAGGAAGATGRLAPAFLAALRSLIEACRSGAVAMYTPSDFPDAELSQEELDKLFS
jgi:hypothetical protein